MQYRILWTWDAWICNPFSAESYISEYKNLIDFAAEWGYNGIIIWGFLDDRHGGAEAAREIARYGRLKGVRILPGVGAGGYHGFYVNGDNRFNLTNFLKLNSHLRAIARQSGEPSDWWLCLYQPESLEWLRDGARWLAENFEIGGVNIETNESGGIDTCGFSKEATADEPNRLKYANSYSDLSRAVPVIYDEIKKKQPDAWITYATYQPPWWERQEDGWLLKKLPKDAVAQWNIEMDLNGAGVASPVPENVALIHGGGWSYHLGAFPPVWAFTQYRCFRPSIEEAKVFAEHQRRNGADGFVIGNTGSPEMPDNELNYIAFYAFTANPDLTVAEFSRQYIADLYGREAEIYVRELMLISNDSSLDRIWRSWVELIFFHSGLHAVMNYDKFFAGRNPAPRSRIKVLAASGEQIDAVKMKIAIAEKAYSLANDFGKPRLRKIIDVLNEYRTIAELSANPAMETLRTRAAELDSASFADEMQKLHSILNKSNFPLALYQVQSFLK